MKTASIGPPDLHIYDSPRPDRLGEISGLPPVAKGTHVLLHGARSAQRLAAGDIGGALWLGIWPAELKEQAVYLYGHRLAGRMISAARRHGWEAFAAPQLAFRSAAAQQRLYLNPVIDASEYAHRWEAGDLSWVWAHSRDELRRRVWPWLKGRG